MKFRQNLAVKILSVMAAVSVLASCGSAPSKVSSKNNSSLPRTATGDDPQKFGAKYNGRSYQQAILSPVASVENKSAVVNQGDFLTQLTNVRDYSNSLTKEQWEKMKKAERKDHAWAPSFSATAFLSDNARIYVRYDETKRMPSIFEDTIGYSIDILTPLYKRKPEHSKNIEVGYVHDLRGFFPSLRRADIRLNWYKNTTKNIFDRDINYEMKQFDKRILEGIELSARYDQGRIFGDIGISYNIKNKFCDKSSAIRDVGRIGDIHTFEAYPECVNGGNENGYLKNAILPKYSITSNLGVRFLDERLEVGTRMVYHTNVKETRNKSLRDAGWFANSNNNPRWQPVFLVDAYMNYKVNENLALSLSATNLTDRYYLDPMTRSSMPAPGRTIKLGLTATF
jgi:hemoglobin/transferrin/lactoferrin receptor protein